MPPQEQQALIEVTERRFGIFPAQFAWADKILQIEAVERCWTELQAASTRYYFKVRCQGQHYRLCEDIASGVWTVESVGQ